MGSKRDRRREWKQRHRLRGPSARRRHLDERERPRPPAKHPRTRALPHRTQRDQRGRGGRGRRRSGGRRRDCARRDHRATAAAAVQPDLLAPRRPLGHLYDDPRRGRQRRAAQRIHLQVARLPRRLLDECARARGPRSRGQVRDHDGRLCAQSGIPVGRPSGRRHLRLRAHRVRRRRGRPEPGDRDDEPPALRRRGSDRARCRRH
mmetsp:Transcript_2087/g.6014  ORF Transcript_2087/g.6014 Transcript_2087/m.6014 type:complete len:205 (-) Transcript_2087:219-833(-)